MYKLKNFLPIKNITEFANKVGLPLEYLIKILQKDIVCNKFIAYSITKAFYRELEIVDLFERV